MRAEAKKWILSFLLSLPLLVFLLSHFFNHSENLHATGFIQYDNVSYVANAKQYLESETFSIFYSNSLNDSENYPRIYFQPQHLVLALLMKMKVPPGLALSLFNYFFAVVLIRILIAVYEYIVPYKKYKVLSIALLTWGGGLSTLIGVLTYPFRNKSFWDAILFLDPGSGWWGLNLGRSLFFSLEGYYHAIFFASVYFILRRNWLWAFVFVLLLSVSHPFTGIELILIICGWIFIEKVFYKNRNISAAFVIGMIAVAAFHIYYYLFYLNRYPDHYSVFHQYSLNWRYRFYHFLPAYAIVGICALLSVWISPSVRTFFSRPANRLFACWAIIAFLLANHELFMKPMQPIHFTRGYIWSALFLLGIPGLHSIMDRLYTKSFKGILLVVFVIIFLLDNILWIYGNTSYQDKENSAALINGEHKQLLDFLKKNTNKQTLLIGSGELIPYLSTVYTDTYSWISHNYNTPFYQQKIKAYLEYIEEGKIPPAWKNRELIFLVEKKDIAEINRFRNPVFPVEKIYESENYLLYRPVSRLVKAASGSD